MLFALLDRWCAPAPDPDRAAWIGRHIYAHRGLHGGKREENSLGAFAAAIAAGLGIECDVRRTLDDRAVVFHDATLERLVGRQGRVDRMTVAEVTATHLALGGEPIPTLRDLLDQVAGRVPVLIELKSDGSRAVLRLCRAVRRDLEGYCGPVAVMSFDPRVPAWFAALAPHILRGLVISEKESRTLSGHLRRHMALWTGKAQFLAYDVNDLPSRFASAQHARGLPLLAWTVSSPALARRARECGAAPIAEGPAIACLTTGA